MRVVLLLSAFYRSRHWALRRVSNLVKIIQPGMLDSKGFIILTWEQWNSWGIKDRYILLLILVSVASQQQRLSGKAVGSLEIIQAETVLTSVRDATEGFLALHWGPCDFHDSLWRSSACFVRSSFYMSPMTPHSFDSGEVPSAHTFGTSLIMRR